jgi:hypothetical protein
LNVRPQRIESRAQQDGRFEARFIGPVQPDYRLVLIAESHIDQGDIGADGRILIIPGFQFLYYFCRFFLPSRHGENMGETGVKGPAVSGNYGGVGGGRPRGRPLSRILCRSMVDADHWRRVRALRPVALVYGTTRLRLFGDEAPRRRGTKPLGVA